MRPSLRTLGLIVLGLGASACRERLGNKVCHVALDLKTRTEATRLHGERLAQAQLQPGALRFPAYVDPSDPKCHYLELGLLVKDQKVHEPVAALAGWLEREAARKGVRTITLSADDLRKRFSMIDELRAIYPRVRKLELKPVGREGQAYTVRLERPDGRAIDLALDRDWKRSCRLFDEVLDADGEISMATREPRSGKAGKMLHPFEGKACSKTALAPYLVWNLSEPGDRAAKLPAMTLLVGDRVPLRGAHAFFRPDGPLREQSKLSAELRDFFAR